MTVQNESLGQRIEFYLKETGMTQRGLAQKVGVTEVSVVRYVKDQRIPRKEILEKIADALNISLDELIVGIDIDIKEPMGDDCSEIIVSSDVVFETVIDAILGNRSCWDDKQKLYLISLLSV